MRAKVDTATNWSHSLAPFRERLEKFLRQNHFEL